MVRVCYTILVALLIVSCSFFGDKRKDLEAVKEEVRKNMDFNDVATYPLFEACKEQELNDKELQRSCFFRELSNHIYKYLEQEEVVANEILQDTLVFNIEVSEDGTFNLIDLVDKNSERSNETIKSLKLICNEAVASLPVILPAQKDGVNAKVKFELPLVLTSN